MKAPATHTESLTPRQLDSRHLREEMATIRTLTTACMHSQPRRLFLQPPSGVGGKQEPSLPALCLRRSSARVSLNTLMASSARASSSGQGRLDWELSWQSACQRRGQRLLEPLASDKPALRSSMQRCGHSPRCHLRQKKKLHQCKTSSGLSACQIFWGKLAIDGNFKQKHHMGTL